MKLLRLLLPLACLYLAACYTQPSDPISSSTSSSSILSSASSSSVSSSLSSSSSSSSSAEPVGSSICPVNDTCVILPLGDSITDGIGSGTRGGGYRVELFSLPRSSHDITYVGNHTPNGPQTVAGQTFPRQHEGHSGWTISQIDAIVPGNSALDDNPHIILLHIGTNDGWQNPNGADGRLDSLVNKILTNNAGSLLAVASIIPWPGQDSFVNAYNQQIPGIVQKYANQGYNIIHVDQNSDFPSSELSDGVHPNNAGYDRMGQTWFNAIKDYLN